MDPDQGAQCAQVWKKLFFSSTQISIKITHKKIQAIPITVQKKLFKNIDPVKNARPLNLATNFSF